MADFSILKQNLMFVHCIFFLLDDNDTHKCFTEMNITNPKVHRNECNHMVGGEMKIVDDSFQQLRKDSVICTFIHAKVLELYECIVYV